MNIGDIYQTKEYKSLQQCALKKCPKLARVIKDETRIVNELVDLNNEIKGKIDLNKSIEVFRKITELSKLQKDKSLLLCKIQDCTSEFIKLQQRTVTYLEKTSRNGEAAIQKILNKKKS